MGIHRAVVFSDEVNDPVRQAIFLCQVNTIGDMADDGLSAGQGSMSSCGFSFSWIWFSMKNCGF